MNKIEYKCPCCDGAIEFDAESGTLKCPYCDTEFDPEAIREYELKSDAAENGDSMDWRDDAKRWSDEEDGVLGVYTCASCGGEIAADENTAATSCPFCGNPVAFSGRLSGELRPDLIIPFKLTKDEAKAALKKHFEGKPLLPKPFKNDAHLDEIHGIYVPFWLFDADANADVRYKATRVSHWSDARFNYTKTSHFSLLRSGSLGFSGVPADGSSKLADDLMDSIEPFDYSEAVDFNAGYLAGYLADRYDVPAESCRERANGRIKKSTEEKFAETTAGFSSVIPEASSVRFTNSKVRYALLPVWVLTTSWESKNYLFAMNGQTGRFVGDLPLDSGAYRRWLFGLTGAIAAGIMLLTFLGYLFGGGI